MEELKTVTEVTDRTNVVTQEMYQETSSESSISNNTSNATNVVDVKEFHESEINETTTHTIKADNMDEVVESIDSEIAEINEDIPEIHKERVNYEVVFFIKYTTINRPSTEEITNFFNNYGRVHHVKCPNNRNYAFVFMQSLNTPAEHRRTRWTISKIIENMTPENKFYITVASSNRQNYYTKFTHSTSNVQRSSLRQSNNSDNNYSHKKYNTPNTNNSIYTRQYYSNGNHASRNNIRDNTNNYPRSNYQSNDNMHSSNRSYNYKVRTLNSSPKQNNYYVPNNDYHGYQNPRSFTTSYNENQRKKFPRQPYQKNYSVNCVNTSFKEPIGDTDYNKSTSK